MADPAKSITVVWYDTNVCGADNQTTREFLESNVGKLVMIKEKDEWKRLLGRDFKHKSVLLITTGQLGQEVVPILHDHANIISIYIFCTDKEFHEGWAKEYSKVRAVVTEWNELASKIFSDPYVE